MARVSQRAGPPGSPRRAEQAAPASPFERTGISSVHEAGVTGEGVCIAILDSGLFDSRLIRRLFAGRVIEGYPVATPGGPPTVWGDESGHGTMVACIAAARGTVPSEFTGAAPGATVLVCKLPGAGAGDGPGDALVPCLEWLLRWKRDNAVQRLVVNASFSLPGPGKRGAPPRRAEVTDDSVLRALDAFDALIRAGALIVTSAGNYQPVDDPSFEGIWHFATLPGVLTVGNTNNPLGEPDWVDASSSRGNGYLFAGEASPHPKPDVVAPAPPGWAVPARWGIPIADEWGTSGASPQVAGLAALIWSKRPGLAAEDVARVIRDSAERIPGFSEKAQGRGLIDAVRSIQSVASEPLP